MNQPPQLPVLVLSIRPPNGRIREIPIATDPRVPATPETAYALIDVADGEAPKSLAAHRDGDDLVVEVQDVEVLVLEGFFSSAGVAFYPTTNIAGGVGLYSGTPLTPQSPGLSQSTDGDKVVWTTDRSDGDGDGGSGMLWGAAAVGGLAAVLAAAGGGGGGSGGGGSSPGTGGGGSAPPPVNNTVEGSVVGGPVIDGNGLSVQVFEADGSSLLGEAKVGADGSFSVSVGSYSGVIIARVVDADTGEDYLDEASGADKDLNATLSAVAAIGAANSTTVVNLNSLTTLAAELAQRQAGSNPPTQADASESNAALAALFGLSNLHAVTVVPVNGGGYDPADGLSAGERYGAILAAFSGADFDNGGDSQQTLDALLAGLTFTGGAAQLSESAQALLVQGALTTDAQTGTSLAQVVSSIVDTFAPQITSGSTAPAIVENSGAGQVVYTAAATDAGAVSYDLGGGDAGAFAIDADTGVVTLTVNPDFEAKPSYSFTVIATDTAGNSAEQPVSLSITDTDDSAPTITSGATADPIDENSGAGQVIYTVTSEDPISDAGSDPTTYSLGAGADAAAFTIDATTGEVTLSADPDFEAKPSYSFTVIATDGDGNSGQQPVTLAINNLDEVAPTITSSGIAPAIDENSGAGQVVYTATSTDTGDVSTGSTAYSLAGADAAAFSIDPDSGEVTLTGDPNFEAKPGYSFSVVATDAAGNSSDPQAVTLAINNLDEVAPTITSSGVAAAINENSGPGQVVYTATSTDTGDVSTGSTAYSLAGADAAAFSIDPDSGAVTLTADPNFEAKSSYSFRVVATDAAGNSSQRTVTLAINNLDEVAPTITSSGVAPAIDENSGAGQAVYTATSTDAGDISAGNTSYSLAGADAAAFNINSASGAVTLKADPDFETKPNYSFAVVATDAAGNSSAPRAVSLAINDIVDETAPTVSSIALTSATGAQNNTLNAGDTVTVTVTMSESTNVDTSGGTPRVALNVGGSTVFAGYVSGTGTNSLSFTYTVQAGDTDLNGISIPTNGLQANGGTLSDATGNVANLSHGSVAGNPSYLVDTTAPTLTSSTPADDAVDVAVGDDLVLVFSEAVLAAGGDLEIRTGGDNRTIDVTDASQVAISGNQVTVDPTDDLEGDSSYRVQIDPGAFTDAAGNPYAGITNNTTLNFDTEALPDPSIVVFDLLEGVNSDHSGRSFDPGTSYTIYIRVDSTDSDLSTDGNGPGPGDSWGTWSGGSNLGSDDRIVLVGSGADVEGEFGTAQSLANVPSGIFWNTFFAAAAFVGQNGQFSRFTGSTDSAVLWSGNWAANPDAGRAFNQVYLTQMPANVLTSQGLA